jgi:hypothetical protein
MITTLGIFGGLASATDIVLLYNPCKHKNKTGKLLADLCGQPSCVRLYAVIDYFWPTNKERNLTLWLPNILELIKMWCFSWTGNCYHAWFDPWGFVADIVLVSHSFSQGVVCLCPCYDVCSSFLSICQDLSLFGSTFHKTMFRQTTVQFFSIKLGRTWSDQTVEEFPTSQETGEWNTLTSSWICSQ